MTTAQRIKTTPTWPVEKVRESAALIALNGMRAAFSVISKFGPEAIAQYEEAWTNNKIEYIKKHNPKTPLELVKVSAEFETNVFGSTLEFWGDEKSATYTYETCGCFKVGKENGMFKEGECSEEMNKFFQASTKRIADTFGYTVTTTMDGKDSFPVITFTKK